MRTLAAALCWATWLCAMIGIIAGNIDDWPFVSLDLKMAGLMVLALYMAGAVIGVKAFKTMWPRDSGSHATALRRETGAARKGGRA